MVLRYRFTLAGMYSDDTGNPWLNIGQKMQNIPIPGTQHNNITHIGTPNWRRPYHLRTSKQFDDWRELQLIDSQRAAPGSKFL